MLFTDNPSEIKRFSRNNLNIDNNYENDNDTKNISSYMESCLMIGDDDVEGTNSRHCNYYHHNIKSVHSHSVYP